MDLSITFRKIVIDREGSDTFTIQFQTEDMMGPWKDLEEYTIDAPQLYMLLSPVHNLYLKQNAEYNAPFSEEIDD